MATIFRLVPIKDIIVDRENRQRTKLIVDDLVSSIQQNEDALPSTFGLLQPIVLRNGLTLVAGERRLEAFKTLGRTVIPALDIENLSEDDAYILELEENYKRLNLKWQEEVRALEKIHERFTKKDPEWTQERTASRLGVSTTRVSQSLSLAEALDSEAEVRNANTFSTAYSILQRKQGRELDDVATNIGFSLRNVLAKAPALTNLAKAAAVVVSHALPLQVHAQPKAEPTAIPEEPKAITGASSLINGDFREWQATYKGPRFNLVHCDFPYAAGADREGSQIHASGDGRVYEDSEETYWQLCEALIEGMDNVVAGSAHLLVWHQTSQFIKTYDFFRLRSKKYGLTVFDVPLIWNKTDGSGVIADASRRYRHIYESALLISRGDRKIVRTCGDVYGAPVSRDLHPSEKPEPMLRHFFRALVSNTTRMLDPTAGSATSLRAAESLGAEFVFGLEKDKEFHKLAVEELDRFRRKRALEALINNGESKDES